MSEAIVDIQNAAKSYGDVRALDGVSLKVHSSETLGLVGPNGAGKTTLLEILQGISSFSEGFISLWGKDVLQGLREEKHRIGVSPQNVALPTYLTVSEILSMYRTFYDDGFSSDELIERVGLSEKRNVRFGRLSGGQKRRLAIALAITGDPEFLILDEPTGDLDPQGRRFIWDLIKHTNRQASRTTIIATHQMDEAESLCERVVIIDHGRILDIGSPQELVEKHCPGHKVLFEISEDITPDTYDQLENENAMVTEKELFSSIEIKTSSMTDSLEKIKYLNASLSVSMENLQIKQSSLEDVFIKLTGRGLRD